MLAKKYTQTLTNLFAENMLLKLVVTILAIGFVWNTYKLNEIKDRVRTVVVPPVINSKIEIYGSWTTDSYAREYIRYISSLLWNYSPGSVRHQFGEALVSWHPEVFEDAKQRLYILAGQIEQTKTASTFLVSKIEHSEKDKTIVVTGTRRVTQQDIQTEVGLKTYIIGYRVENGRFWIMGMEEKGSGKPAVGTKTGAVETGGAR